MYRRNTIISLHRQAYSNGASDESTFESSMASLSSSSFSSWISNNESFEDEDKAMNILISSDSKTDHCNNAELNTLRQKRKAMDIDNSYIFNTDSINEAGSVVIKTDPTEDADKCDRSSSETSSNSMRRRGPGVRRRGKALKLLEYSDVKKALLRYKELYGDFNVKRRFIVPPGSADWPEDNWGCKLGSIVVSIKKKALYFDMRNDLISIGFDFHTATSGNVGHGWDKIEVALRRYEFLHGNMQISAGFIIPEDSNDWPVEVRGIRLGKVVRHIKDGHSYPSKRSELIEMGLISKVS